MHVHIISCHHRLSSWVQDACNDWLKQLAHYKIQRFTCKPSLKKSASERMLQEAQAMQKYMSAFNQSGITIIALDVLGKAYSSVDFAKYWQSHLQNYAHICLIIGGPDGLSSDILELATMRLSLSPLTLTHEIAQLVLIEQIYRADKILQNHPYHRD